MPAVADQYCLFYEGNVIMSGVAEYILTVTAAAVICSVIKSVAGADKATGKIIKIIAGAFMTVTLVSPFLDFSMRNIADIFADYEVSGIEFSEYGNQMAADAAGEIIKNKTEAYILNEASNLDLDITVDVTLSGSDPPVPYQVSIAGTVSPYKKSVLSHMMTTDLGILVENQLWT